MLPILTNSYLSLAVDVPCSLPPFQINVFLPWRGVVGATVFLTSDDPTKAEVRDVVPLNGALDSFPTDDETKRLSETASDVLDAVLERLGLSPVTRKPAPVVAAETHNALHVIAAAWSAEKAAVGAAQNVLACFRTTNGMNPAAQHEIGRLIPNLDKDGSGRRDSPALEAMACWVDFAIDEACVAQAEKAYRDAAEWLAEHGGGDSRPSGWEGPLAR